MNKILQGAKSQHVLKAEAARPDATDRDAHNASPVGGPMGVGQPAAAGPTGGFYAEHIERMVQGYAQLAQIDVAIDFVWDRINDLAESDPLLWGQLPELVQVRSKAIQAAAAASRGGQ